MGTYVSSNPIQNEINSGSTSYAAVLGSGIGADQNAKPSYAAQLQSSLLSAAAKAGSDQQGKTVTVKTGDTLWAIAKNELGHGSRWPEIADANGIRNPRSLQPGTVLRINGGAPPPAPRQRPAQAAAPAPAPSPRRQAPAPAAAPPTTAQKLADPNIVMSDDPGIIPRESAWSRGLPEQRGAAKAALTQKLAPQATGEDPLLSATVSSGKEGNPSQSYAERLAPPPAPVVAAPPPQRVAPAAAAPTRRAPVATLDPFSTRDPNKDQSRPPMERVASGPAPGTVPASGRIRPEPQAPSYADATQGSGEDAFAQFMQEHGDSPALGYADEPQADVPQRQYVDQRTRFDTEQPGVPTPRERPRQYQESRSRFDAEASAPPPRQFVDQRSRFDGEAAAPQRQFVDQRARFDAEAAAARPVDPQAEIRARIDRQMSRFAESLKAGGKSPEEIDAIISEHRKMYEQQYGLSPQGEQLSMGPNEGPIGGDDPSAALGRGWTGSGPDPFADIAAKLQERQNPTTQAAGPTQTAERFSYGGAADAGIRGAAQGATAQFGDEIAGAFGGIMDMLGAGPEGSKGTFSGGYERTRDKARALDEQAATDHPVANTAGEVGGILATIPLAPEVAIAKAGPAAGRLARGGAALVNSGAEGAAYGAAYGAGNADGGLADRGQAALEGAGTGLALGVGGRALVGTTKAAVGGAVDRFAASGGKLRSAVASGVRAKISGVDREANRRVQDAIRRDTGEGPMQAASRMRTRQAEGHPYVVGDLGSGDASRGTTVGAGTNLIANHPSPAAARGGRATTSLARSAANTSQEGRAALENVTQGRADTQNVRAESFLKTLVHRTPESAKMTREELQTASQGARKSFYDRFYADSSKGLMTPRLEQMVTDSPTMRSALKEAARSIADKQGAGRNVTAIAANGNPTGAAWDQVKRSLDGMYNRAKSARDTELAGDLDTLRKGVTAEVDAAFPSYVNARGVASTIFKAGDAAEAGEQAARQGSKVNNNELARGLSKMTPEEQTLFREHYVGSFVDQVSSVKDRRSILNAINASPNARRRNDIVLGKQGADKLDTFMRVEGVMDRLHKEVTGNSSTARQITELTAAGGIGAVYGGGFSPYDPSTWLPSLLVGAATAGIGKGAINVDRKVAQRVGEMLASHDPSILEKGVAIVAKNKNLSRLLDTVERSIYRLPTALAAQPSR